MSVSSFPWNIYLSLTGRAGKRTQYLLVYFYLYQLNSPLSYSGYTSLYNVENIYSMKDCDLRSLLNPTHPQPQPPLDPSTLG